MRKRYIAITGGIAVIAIVLVVIFVAPLGIVGDSNNSTDATNTTPAEPPADKNWISPAKILVDSYDIGAQVELLVEVHNGNGNATEFSVDYRWPDNLTEGYSKPTGASDWIKVKDKFPIIPAHETYTAKVWLYIPDGTEPPADKFEFWIGVIDRSQTGMIQVELCTRVLVTMK